MYRSNPLASLTLKPLSNRYLLSIALNRIAIASRHRAYIDRPLSGNRRAGHIPVMTAVVKTTRRGMRRTLGHLVQHQLTLWMHCHKCRCAAKLDVQRLVETHGAEIILKEIWAKCICDNCGAIWPDVHVQVPPTRPKRRAPPDDLSDAHL